MRTPTEMLAQQGTAHHAKKRERPNKIHEKRTSVGLGRRACDALLREAERGDDDERDSADELLSTTAARSTLGVRQRKARAERSAGQNMNGERACVRSGLGGDGGGRG